MWLKERILLHTVALADWRRDRRSRTIFWKVSSSFLLFYFHLLRSFSLLYMLAVCQSLSLDWNASLTSSSSLSLFPFLSQRSFLYTKEEEKKIDSWWRMLARFSINAWLYAALIPPSSSNFRSAQLSAFSFLDSQNTQKKKKTVHGLIRAYPVIEPL